MDPPNPLWFSPRSQPGVPGREVVTARRWRSAGLRQQPTAQGPGREAARRFWQSPGQWPEVSDFVAREDDGDQILSPRAKCDTNHIPRAPAYKDPSGPRSASAPQAAPRTRTGPTMGVSAPAPPPLPPSNGIRAQTLQTLANLSQNFGCPNSVTMRHIFENPRRAS